MLLPLPQNSLFNSLVVAKAVDKYSWMLYACEANTLSLSDSKIKIDLVTEYLID